MSFTITQHADSPRWTGRGWDMRLNVEGTDAGTDTPAAARAAVDAWVTANYASGYDGYPGQGIQSIEPMAGLATHYIATVGFAYGAGFSGTGSGYTLSFDTTGGTQHIEAGIVQTRFPATSPDVGNLIGVTAERIEGTDIPLRAMRRSETWTKSAGDVTETYINNVFSATGKVNSDVFRGRAAGEVLFLGASGQTLGNGQWSITYQWSISPNRTNITVGAITGISKGGWDYIWTYKTPLVVTAGAIKVLTQKAEAVYVAQVFERINLAATLGI